MDTELNPYEIKPLRTIWFRPRETIQAFTHMQSEKLIGTLAVLYGIMRALEQFSEKSLGDNSSLLSIILMAAILGPIVGILNLYVFAALMSWTGKWFGGKASSGNMRTVLAFSWSPYIVGVFLLLLIEFSVQGAEVFSSSSQRLYTLLQNDFIPTDIMVAIYLFSVILFGLAAQIYRLVLLVIGYSQVQGFTVWRSLAAVIVSNLILVIPVALAIIFLF